MWSSGTAGALILMDDSWLLEARRAEKFLLKSVGVDESRAEIEGADEDTVWTGVEGILLEGWGDGVWRRDVNELV